MILLSAMVVLCCRPTTHPSLVVYYFACRESPELVGVGMVRQRNRAVGMKCTLPLATTTGDNDLASCSWTTIWSCSRFLATIVASNAMVNSSYSVRVTPPMIFSTGSLVVVPFSSVDLKSVRRLCPTGAPHRSIIQNQENKCILNHVFFPGIHTIRVTFGNDGIKGMHYSSKRRSLPEGSTAD